jgi:hypothetical protein
MGSLRFFIDISFRPRYGHGTYSACNTSEYQGYPLGVKAAVALGWQPCRLSTNSGCLTHPPEPIGAVQTWTRFALPGIVYKCWNWSWLRQLLYLSADGLSQQLRGLNVEWWVDPRNTPVTVIWAFIARPDKQSRGVLISERAKLIRSL